MATTLAWGLRSTCGEISHDGIQELLAYLMWRSCAQTEEFSHRLNGDGRTAPASLQ